MSGILKGLCRHLADGLRGFVSGVLTCLRCCPEILLQALETAPTLVSQSLVQDFFVKKLPSQQTTSNLPQLCKWYEALLDENMKLRGVFNMVSRFADKCGETRSLPRLPHGRLTCGTRLALTFTLAASQHVRLHEKQASFSRNTNG